MTQARHANATARRTPERSCVVCRTRLPKAQLLRHVCPTGGDARHGLVPDPEQRLPGRGFYVCAGEACRNTMQRFQGWRRKCKGVAYDE